MCIRDRGNYTLGIQEQIIFPEINIDSITRILGMNITFVTSAQTCLLYTSRIRSETERLLLQIKQKNKGSGS